MSLRNRLIAASVSLIVASTPSLSHSHNTRGVTGPESADGKIVLYRTAWCGYCKHAAAYMQKKNIGFVERDIETNSRYMAEFSRLNGRGVPLLVFGKKTMSGFNEAAFERKYADFKRHMGSSPNSAAAASTAP